MKKQLVNVLTKLAFLSMIALVTAVGSAQGQSLEYKLSANIPFDFVVGDKKLPAGKYSIVRLNQQFGDSLLLISSADRRANVIRRSIPAESHLLKNKGTLVFHRYGVEHFLFQVWPAGASTGRELTRSRIERNLATISSAGMMVQKTQAVETVNIAADPQ